VGGGGGWEDGGVVESVDEPGQADAVVPVLVGTVLWGIALVVLIAVRQRLVENGTDWWIAVAATGFALGLLGSWWVRRRRDAYRAAGRTPS